MNEPIELQGDTAQERNAWLRSFLHEGVFEIAFTKVDGSERVMPCTLKTDAMPAKAVTEHHQTRVYKPDSLSVWCVDKQEWRSFRVMNVTSVKRIAD
jgi:hypothetical protein